MCGIISVLSFKDKVAKCIISSLERLEYRGYDSAGISYIDENSKLQRIRSVGKINNLKNLLDLESIKSHIGIGHTRWATHGKVTVSNAHPHNAEGISIVHNGIIENFEDLKKTLIEKGEVFESETDSEVIAKLISYNIKNGLSFIDAFQKAISIITGTYAVAAIYEKEPNTLIGAKKGSPMALGVSPDKMSVYVASDAIALSSLAEEVTYLEEGDIAICKRNSEDITYTILDNNFKEVSRKTVKNTVSFDDVNKGGFEDFMLKEIFEEPKVIFDTFNNEFKKPDLSKYNKICFIACGTSYYAGYLAKYWIEDLARIHVDVEIASEFRYRNPVLSKDTLYVFISQSGETCDTLSAMRDVKSKGLDTLAVVNVDTSSIAREADYFIKTMAGTEIGVASTKAFVAQAMALLLLAVDKSEIDVEEIMMATQSVLNNQLSIKTAAEKIKNSKSMLYLGRGTSYPIALEGSLKVKELSYISAEGYPSGEIKHGPIALIDESVYSIILAPKDRYFEKTISNAQEVLARKGKIILITTEDSKDFLQNIATDENVSIISIPNIDTRIQPFPLATTIHLLAYYTAKGKGIDVDKPRNLAKSVTVE